MRLLTQNMLQCNVKKCTQGYPLFLEQVQHEQENIEFNKEFLERLIEKIDWKAFQTTLRNNLNWEPYIQTPPIYSNADDSTETLGIQYDENNQEWWEWFHEFLLNRKIIHAKMTCPKCHHVFPITDGIPNMLLREDENTMSV